MQIRKVWKFIVGGVLIGAAMVGVAACSGGAAPQTAAAAPVASNLILSSDMVIGSGGTPAPATSCVLDNVYKPGEEVVFRVRVYDPSTGKPMDDKALSSVTISLPDGQSFKASYAGHPHTNPVDYFWATSWTIPANYPSGTLSYTAKATATDGRTGTFDNFNVAASLLTVIQ